MVRNWIVILLLRVFRMVAPYSRIITLAECLISGFEIYATWKNSNPIGEKNNGNSERMAAELHHASHHGPSKPENLSKNRGAGHFPGHIVSQTGIPEAIVCGGENGEENRCPYHRHAMTGDTGP